MSTPRIDCRLSLIGGINETHMKALIYIIHSMKMETKQNTKHRLVFFNVGRNTTPCILGRSIMRRDFSVLCQDMKYCYLNIYKLT